MPIDSEAICCQPLPGFAGFAAPALLHAKGMVEDYRAWVKPWGFTFEQSIYEFLFTPKTMKIQQGRWLLYFGHFHGKSIVR
jgi:hypothetical protein